MANQYSSRDQKKHNDVNRLFLDSSFQIIKPEFITNNHKLGKKVLASVEKELENCNEFMISVAFITSSGITPLLQVLKDLEERNIKGRILTTDYLMFSEPAALEKLTSLSNVQLKIYCVSSNSGGFHTKGYIFEQNETYSFIIGSSNLTLDALTRNKEWNIKLHTEKENELTKEIISEFNSLWFDTKSFIYQDFGDQYKSKYYNMKKLREAVSNYEVNGSEHKIVPNKMQENFIRNLNEMISNKIEKALLISSTGTGKTYAAAFAVKELNPNKVLFLVHREQIARQAMKSFKEIFSENTNKEFGLLSGSKRDLDADYLFSTMQMMSKQDVHERNFDKNEFDIIIIDEVHHAGAESYRRIMDYFKPKFWLGMTASPDTSNYDIYRIFDNNIAYEIRLQQALEEELICPFHYFGIRELEIDGEVIDDDAISENFNMLVSDERVKHISEKANFYGFCGDRVKGLIFCRRKDEARELSIKFNLIGYKTDYLTGEDNQERRMNIIKMLVGDNKNDYLDYIFTVDIFNEGIDIPEVNQVIMLRRTESPVVFVQQLGRGLRISDNKDYVVIIDFIGNYRNNFMIPIALSGIRSYNKNDSREFLFQGYRYLPGSSTIHFDEISKRRIFDSINKFNAKKELLTNSYKALENKINRTPRMIDFYNFGELDPQLFIDYSKSYHSFLISFENRYDTKLSDNEIKTIEFVSLIFANGKRPHELAILDCLLENKLVRVETVKKRLEKDYNINSDKSIESAINGLTKRFINDPKFVYGDVRIVDIDDEGNLISYVYDMCEINRDLYYHLKDVVDIGLRKYEDIYEPAIDEYGLSLYKKYFRKDICRILNWEKDESSTIFGYTIKYNTCPIFVTYNKKEDITSSTKYRDAFIDNSTFKWETRNNVKINSKESQAIINHNETDLKIFLFIKKGDDEGKDFYYMGTVTPESYKELTIDNDKGKELPITEFVFKLTNPVKDSLFDYIIKD